MSIFSVIAMIAVMIIGLSESGSQHIANSNASIKGDVDTSNTRLYNRGNMLNTRAGTGMNEPSKEKKSYDLLVCTFSLNAEKSAEQHHILHREMRHIMGYYGDQFSVITVYAVCSSIHRSNRLTGSSENGAYVFYLNCTDSYQMLYSKTHSFWGDIFEFIDARFYLKIDSDSVVCWGRVIPYIMKLPTMTCPFREGKESCEFYVGNILTKGKMRDDTSHRWYDRELMRAYSDVKRKIPHYWPYAEGGFYIISRGLVRILNQLKRSLAYMVNEDAMVGSWVLGLDKVILDTSSSGPLFYHPVKNSAERKAIFRGDKRILDSLRFRSLNSSLCFHDGSRYYQS